MRDDPAMAAALLRDVRGIGVFPHIAVELAFDL
jgi:hypothetical protein